MDFIFLCLFLLVHLLSRAFSVIFLLYLVCLILKLFSLCVVFPSGLDVNSSALTLLTQSFLMLASCRIFLFLLAWVLAASLGSSYFIPALPLSIPFFSYLFNSVCVPVHSNNFYPSFPKSGHLGSNVTLFRCHWQALKPCSLFCLPGSCSTLYWESL